MDGAAGGLEDLREARGDDDRPAHSHPRDLLRLCDPHARAPPLAVEVLGRGDGRASLLGVVEEGEVERELWSAMKVSN